MQFFSNSIFISELQRSIFGTSPGAQNASSTSPDKLLANPVSMVTSVAPGSSASKGAFSFGQQSLKTDTRSTSSFGQVSSTTPGGVHNLITSATKASTTTPGADGNTCKFPLKENIIACKLSKETSLANSPLKTSDGYMDQGYEPNVNFKPVIDLPDLIETQTDEEEEAVFCEQATLFRFDNGQWKENTIVQLKLLRLKQTKRVRLFMRRDRVLKVCANHFLTKEMKLSPMQSSKKAWYWDVHFQYKGKIQITKIAVCFKGEDLALKFKATFEKMQSELDQVQSNQVEKEHAKTVNTDKPSLGSMFKIEEGSWSCPSCLVLNKSDVQKCATCRTLKTGTKREDVKQTESSNIFGLPSAIRSQTLQFQEGQITTGKVEKKDPPLMSSSLVSMSSTQSVNSAMYTIPGAQPQSTESHQPIDGPSPGAHTAGTVSSSSSNLTTLPLVCSLQSASTSPDKPLANPVSMVTTNAPGSSAPKGIFRFGQQPVTSGTQSTFSFGHVPSLNPGAGKNISPSSTKASTTNSGAVGNICISPQKKNVIACKSSKETSLVTSPLKISDNSVLRGKEPDFKPVIDLPDGVETKNGEKEGETVFCEKATLLRFDDGF
ncbi:NUP358 [Mytilus edulis]|uniref:RANBP2 n=1 Tax=Mytilus edulis TaxID=6550 RepID=A0A8S3U8G7_MYTED|nr:NUP358 [Mytilus edulis]